MQLIVSPLVLSESFNIVNRLLPIVVDVVVHCCPLGVVMDISYEEPKEAASLPFIICWFIVICVDVVNCLNLGGKGVRIIVV